MEAQITIIYITDNALDERLAEVCKKYLLIAAKGKPLLTVSQKPLDFGENICVGDIGRNGLSIDKQIREGLLRTKTRFIAIAEHDCIYSEEHFSWLPPEEKHFYYNHNNWLLQYFNPKHPDYDGMFSYKRRMVQSQLIAGRESMLEATNQKIEILSDPKVQVGWPVRTRLGEPGTTEANHAYRVFKSKGLLNKWLKVKKYITKHNAKEFGTQIPNIDVRHGGNLTGARRGKHRRFALEPWGTMEDIMSIE